MGKYVELTIRADVPDDNHELGHEAIVHTREPVAAIVVLLGKIGLTNITQARRIGSTKTRAATQAALAVAAE